MLCKIFRKLLSLILLQTKKGTEAQTDHISELNIVVKYYTFRSKLIAFTHLMLEF